MKTINIGQRIRQIVEEQHWNFSDFAKAINCSRSSLYHLFNSQDVSLIRLIQISIVLKYNLVEEVINEFGCLDDVKLDMPNNPYIAIPFVESEIDLSGLPPCIVDMLKKKLWENETDSIRI